jgi:2-oxoacid:acceptor oxidoreductase gamma subunit (pyruvate/2-ketoisovalerate family)
LFTLLILVQGYNKLITTYFFEDARLIEIRFHGRGGQGAVVASELLARAAVINRLHAAAFPFFGVERRGAPVTAFCRIDLKPIRTHSEIYYPDFVVVLDPSLLGLTNLLQGLKPDGQVLVNTTACARNLSIVRWPRVATVDATGIALRHGLGVEGSPIVNTAIIGAFSKLCPQIPLECVMESIRKAAPSKKEENATAAKEAFEMVMGV